MPLGRGRGAVGSLGLLCRRCTTWDYSSCVGDDYILRSISALGGIAVGGGRGDARVCTFSLPTYCGAASSLFSSRVSSIWVSFGGFLVGLAHVCTVKPHMSGSALCSCTHVSFVHTCARCRFGTRLSASLILGVVLLKMLISNSCCLPLVHKFNRYRYFEIDIRIRILASIGIDSILVVIMIIICISYFFNR